MSEAIMNDDISEAATFWFDDDDIGQPDVAAWVRSAFELVVAFAKEQIGPLEGFTYEYARGPDARSRAVLDGVWRVGLVPICDGERQFGGALERFFAAHHKVSLYVADPIRHGMGTSIIDFVNYGRALQELSYDIPGLRT